MKRVVMVVLVALGSCQPVDFKYADGGPGRYSDWHGRWVVINYWAEWCAPCRYEIPQLNALHRTEAGHDALVIGVNFDGIEGESLRQLVQRMSIEFPVMSADPRSRFGYDLPAVLPTTVVIDPRGSIAATLVGPQTEGSIVSVLGVTAPL